MNPSFSWFHETPVQAAGDGGSATRRPRFDEADQAELLAVYDRWSANPRSLHMAKPEFNTDLLDDLVLALLWFNGSETEFGAHSAWKSLPWDALDRLHARGLISEPRRKTHSVALDDAAWTRGQALFEQWFGAPAQAPASSKAGKPAKAVKAASKSTATVHQFRINLDHTRPVVWRRIQLPSGATFWDLHCTINDAMGWEDAHLHEFRLGDKRDSQRIGIPMEGDTPWNDDDALADWDVPIATHFAKPGASCDYLYDFGDGWSHKVKFEAILPRESGIKYPRCLDGARACPPEDCGGPPGYERLCAALADPAGADEDTAELLDWFADYDPAAFDPAEVKFHSAARRLKELRGGR
jgi:hypothetical protein